MDVKDIKIGMEVIVRYDIPRNNVKSKLTFVAPMEKYKGIVSSIVEVDSLITVSYDTITFAWIPDWSETDIRGLKIGDHVKIKEYIGKTFTIECIYTRIHLDGISPYIWDPNWLEPVRCDDVSINIHEAFL